jgi:hypothetical protein
VAVSCISAKHVEFYGNDPTGGILKTLSIPPKENKRKPFPGLNNLKSFLFYKDFSKVRNKKMSDILSGSKFNYVDFMFIDVEGGELELIKSIDFSFPIFCIIVEAHSDQQEKNQLVRDFLLSKGFSFRERQRGNEIWINHNYFRKDLFTF